MANSAEAPKCSNKFEHLNTITLRSAYQTALCMSLDRKTRLIVGTVLFLLMMKFLLWPRTTDASQHGECPDAALNSSTEPGYQHTHLLISDGEIQGHKTRCVLDTGAAMTAVDNSLAKRFVGGEPRHMNFQLTSRAKELSVYDDIPVAFADIAAKQTTVVALDLSAARSVVAQDINAVIGMDLLGSRVLLLGGTEPRFVSSLPEAIQDYSRFPLLFSRVPLLPLELPVVGVRDFVVDTGSNGCLSIDEKLAEILIRSGHAVEFGRGEKADGAGVQVDRKLIIREITLLGVRFENMLASVSAVNLIGMQVLMRFDLTFDFPNQQYLLGDTANVDTTPPPPVDCGLALAFRTASSLEVCYVQPDSDADRAGFQVDDEVITIDGRSPHKLTRSGLLEILSRDGKTVHFELRRGNESMEIEMLLKRPYDYPPKWRVSPSDDSEFFESIKREK